MSMTKHIVGFSGGIDSQACARWVLNRYPKEDVILLNFDAGGNDGVFSMAQRQALLGHTKATTTMGYTTVDL